MTWRVRTLLAPRRASTANSPTCVGWNSMTAWAMPWGRATTPSGLPPPSRNSTTTAAGSSHVSFVTSPAPEPSSAGGPKRTIRPRSPSKAKVEPDRGAGPMSWRRVHCWSRQSHVPPRNAPPAPRPRRARPAGLCCRTRARARLGRPGRCRRPVSNRRRPTTRCPRGARRRRRGPPNSTVRWRALSNAIWWPDRGSGPVSRNCRHSSPSYSQCVVEQVRRNLAAEQDRSRLVRS